jgi:alpha-tubulin suppressor-like RCC1 family protein
VSSGGETIDLNTSLDDIIQIVAGDAHNFVLTASGKLFAFGYNNRGQCGVGVAGNKNVHTPKQVDMVCIESDLGTKARAPLFVSVAAGRDHSLAVSIDGDVFVTGSN